MRFSSPILLLVALAYLRGLAACRGSSPTAEKPAGTSSAEESERARPPAPAGDAPSFGLYVLALSWAPSFCCSHANKEECSALPGSFAATHLTLHGLWPNYLDAEQKGRATYPQFCGPYTHCQKAHDATCEPDPAAIPAEMQKLAPGYLGDGYFLADHEWPKHGSCTGLDAATYFKAALGAMKQRPGEAGTPAVLRAAVGKEIALTDLQGAFGMPASSVLVSCDAECRLSQVSFCLAHDAKGMPTTPIACPENTTTSQYDNGCVTRGCDQVAVQAAGSCDARRGGRGGGSGGGENGGGGNGGGARAPRAACNHPGQGPACADDAACKEAGFLRCARSGCCTSQPR